MDVFIVMMNLKYWSLVKRLGDYSNKKVRFLWKRGENKWHVIIVRTVILMIVMMVGIAIKIVKVLS